MVYNNFYRLQSRGYETTFAATPVIFENAIKEGINDYNRHCHKHLLVGEYDRYQFPIIFQQYDGKRLRDFLDTGYPPVYLVSDRVVNILENNGISGWKTYPITLYDKNGNLVGGFSGFSILGNGGVFSKLWDYGYDPKKIAVLLLAGAFMTSANGMALTLF